MKINKPIIKVLQKHLSLWQVLGFFLANIIGLAILFSSILAYKDLAGFFEQEAESVKHSDLVISKEVSGLSTFGLSDNSFSQDDITDLLAQNDIEEVGAFTPALYHIRAGLELGMYVYSDIFFECVDDKYLDIQVEDWGFAYDKAKLVPQQEWIPIILPRTYLTLYNSAFSSSQGLPKIGESLVANINLDLHLSGQGRVKEFKGRVVGFSKKINTILVPKDFISWSNEYFAKGKSQPPSRLILRVKDPNSTQLIEYLQKEGYQTDAETTDNAMARLIFQLISLFLFSMGLLISALALYLMMLSVLLLLEKSGEELQDLNLLGFSRSLLGRPFYLISLILMIVSNVFAGWGAISLRSLYLTYIKKLFPDYLANAEAYYYLLAVALASVLLSAIVVKLSLSKLWRKRDKLD